MFLSLIDVTRVHCMKQAESQEGRFFLVNGYQAYSQRLSLVSYNEPSLQRQYMFPKTLPLK